MVCVTGVHFVKSGNEENETGGTEDKEEGHPWEANSSPTTNSRGVKGKMKGKGKGKAPKRDTPDDEEAEQMKPPAKKQKLSPAVEHVPQITHNNIEVKEDVEVKGQWPVELSLGSNIVEVGEKGGVVWRVYVERTAPI